MLKNIKQMIEKAIQIPYIYKQMKLLIIIMSLTLSVGAFATQPLRVDRDQNQEELVVQDLEQIQNHGKKWHSKLKKATTAIMPISGRQAQNEG